jgi:hypothetical protein
MRQLARVGPRTFSSEFQQIPRRPRAVVMMNVAIQIEHGNPNEPCVTGIAMMFDSATKRYRNDRGVGRDGQHLPIAAVLLAAVLLITYVPA